VKRPQMAVIAIFKYQIKPGRLPDFMGKLAAAADPKFASPAMPKSVRAFRPDTGIVLMIEYEDMAAYGARTASRPPMPNGSACSSRPRTRRRRWSRWSC
jgi:hypothetical protein